MYSIILSQENFLHKDSLTFPIEERALQFGDGVYEVIRLYDGKPYLLEEHMKRLFRSLEAIRIPLPFTQKTLINLLHELLKRNDMKQDGIIYFQVSRGSASRSHIFPENTKPNIYAYIEDQPRYNDLLKKGVKAITLEDDRWANCYIKSLNLLPNVLAKQTAAEEKAYEAIFHRDSIVTECSSSNVFLVKDNTIFTHPAEKQILNGCVRMAVKRLAEKLAISWDEKPFTLDDLETADEMFLTSSISEVMPIVQVNDKQVANGLPGEITLQLQEAYEKDAGLHVRKKIPLNK